VTASVQFDTFSTTYFTWEADDFDFNGGLFIDAPVLSTNSPDSYYDQVGVSNVDEYVPNYSPTQPHLWRTNDDVSTALSLDTPRTQFVTAGIPDYLVGYFDPSNWVNYTRTFPAGTYNIYARLANGNGGLANCTLAEVTNGEGTVSQMLTPLGTFQFTGSGWNNFNFVPLTDQWGNLLAINLNGKTTLRVTSGQLGGGVNMNFFMLVPGSNTPPAIASIYPDGLQPFETTNSLAFTVSSSLSTVSQNNVQVTLNGVNVSSQLVFGGASTNWSVSLPLSQQGYYTAVITATDAAGHSNTYTESFDNFSQSNLMIEADAWDFNGGQFITNPIETGEYVSASEPDLGPSDPNSYNVYPEGDPSDLAIPGVDYDDTNSSAGETYVFRVLELAGTQPATDFVRQKFISGGATNTAYNIGWWNPGTWLNYTRIVPTNTYNIYGRLAAGSAFTGVTISLVTNGVGTTSQQTQLLGSMSDPNADGFQAWHWVPMVGTNGQLATVTLGGTETFQATAGTGQNALFYMLVPASVTTALPVKLGASVSGGQLQISFPTQINHSYTVYWSATLGAGANWQALEAAIPGNGSQKTVTDSLSNGARYYLVVAQ
jgi:hypothetical protein